MKKLAKSMLLALGFLPLSLFADDSSVDDATSIVPLRLQQSPVLPLRNAMELLESSMESSVSQPFLFTTAAKVKIKQKPAQEILTKPKKEKPVVVTPIVVENNTPSVFTQTRAIVQLMQGGNTGGQLDFLMPFYGNETSFLYTDLQAYKYGTLYQTLSASVGGRSFAGNAIYGAYAFYDFQTSENGFNYNRFNVGLERLGEAWEWRANFYSYLDGENQINDLGQSSAFITGNDINYVHEYEAERAYSLGGDLEMGRSLGLDALRGYVAYYNYGNEISGARVRLTYDLGSHWQVLGTGQYDATRGWLAYGAINYWIGKAKTNTGTALDKLRDPIIRDMTVATKIVDTFNHIDADSRHIYFANPNGNANATGTESDPMNLDTALATAQPGDFIYLEGGDYNLNSAINLKANQILWGTNADLYTQGATGLLLVPSTDTLTNLAADHFATLNNANCDIYICAIYATNPGQYGGFNITNNTTYNGTPTFVGFLISYTHDVNVSNINASGFKDTNPAVNGIGFNIEYTTNNADSVFNNITANDNDVGIQFDHANFNHINNIVASNNIFKGIAIRYNSIITTADTITANNNGLLSDGATYGVIVEYGGQLLNGTHFTLIGNGTQIMASDAGAYAYLLNPYIESLALNPGAAHTALAALSQATGTLVIANPTTLIGQVWSTLGSKLVITSNGLNDVPNQSTTATSKFNCRIKNSVGGPCTLA